MPKAWVEVTPGKSTSTDLKFRWCLDPARAVPSGTAEPATNRVAKIVNAAILRFFMSSPSPSILREICGLRVDSFSGRGPGLGRGTAGQLAAS